MRKLKKKTPQIDKNTLIYQQLNANDLTNQR